MGTNIKRPNAPGKPALEQIFQNATAGKMHVTGKMMRMIIIMVVTIIRIMTMMLMVSMMIHVLMITINDIYLSICIQISIFIDSSNKHHMTVITITITVIMTIMIVMLIRAIPCRGEGVHL